MIVSILIDLYIIPLSMSLSDVEFDMMGNYFGPYIRDLN